MSYCYSSDLSVMAGGGPGEGSRRLSGDHMVVRGNSRLKQILKEGL